MLSFDITDRNIRIIKGAESGNKIKISSAATLDLEDGLIANGHVKDVPRLATLVNGVLKKSKMFDKEAIVSISSNLTIFKELRVPAAKEAEFAKKVKSEMQAALNIDDSYSISYIVVGDDGEKNEAGESLQKVLATACPYEIVECYRKVFQMLGISLKSVMIGCNCITKVLLADTRVRSKMPLLAVQIDPNFISLNLYEKNQLTFSRFASIDPADYGNSADYVFEAVNENIFRMIQFFKSRSRGETLENIIFYGDTREYVRLTNELEKMDLKANLISVPPQIHGYENLEFSLYANAIGAMFKRNPTTEKVNLLSAEGVAARRMKEDSSFGLMALGALAGSLIIVGGVWFGFKMQSNKIASQIKDINEWIDSPDTVKKLKHRDKLEVMDGKVELYENMMVNISDAYHSKPIIQIEKFDRLDEILRDTVNSVESMFGTPFSYYEEAGADGFQIKRAEIMNSTYNEGTFTLQIELQGMADPSQKVPALFVENLLKDSMVGDVIYTGYTVTNVEGFVRAGSEDNTDDFINVEVSPYYDNVTGERSLPEGSAGPFSQTLVTFSVQVKINGEISPYHALEEAQPAEGGN